MNLKKKEIAIYAIALMLVTAGYFNYLKFDNSFVETSVNTVENEVKNSIINERKNDNDSIRNDSKKENNYKYNNNENDNDNENNNNNNDDNDNSQNHEEQNDDSQNDDDIINKKEVVALNGEENDKENKINIGDAVLVSSNEIDENNSNYYAETKLERNKMYAEMIKNYENLINNTNLSEVQKSIATEEIKKINNNKNAIMICENLILSKGFEECVILVNEKSINVVVHIDGGLNIEKVSQIQNIISRELSVEIENIHISEK